MYKWTYNKLIDEGYRVENARITRADLSMADHGVLCLELVLEGGAWGCVFGGYVLGHGYVGADDEYFNGSGDGMESIIRIMDVIGKERFNSMKGELIRVAIKGISEPVKIIGNIIDDKWFDIDSFFKDRRLEK